MSRRASSLIGLIESIGARHVAEIGVASGELSADLIRAGVSSLLMVDQFTRPGRNSTYSKSGDRMARWRQPQHDSNRAQAQAVADASAGVATLFVGTSTDAAKHVANGSLDLVFIDAAHDYENVRADIAAWRPKLRPGGILCGHDYRSYPGVKQAVDETFPHRRLHHGDIWSVAIMSQQPVIVRSLWTSKNIQVPKVFRDVLRAKRQPGECVYAFDDNAAEFLKLAGITHHRLPDKQPPQYAKCPQVSVWWKKLAAIRAAIVLTGRPVVHLDWDTHRSGDMPDLTDGPAFQGRIRNYKKRQFRQRGEFARFIYHGGAFLIRDLPTIDRVIELHATNCPTHTDEVALTLLADLLAGSTDPAEHRRQGFDNPALHRSINSTVASDVAPAFCEGRILRAPKVLRWLAELVIKAERPKRKPRKRPAPPRPGMTFAGIEYTAEQLDDNATWVAISESMEAK